jgi:hypothetical protein
MHLHLNGGGRLDPKRGLWELSFSGRSWEAIAKKPWLAGSEKLLYNVLAYNQ